MDVEEDEEAFAMIGRPVSLESRRTAALNDFLLHNTEIEDA
jgi:hypothetical protein